MSEKTRAVERTAQAVIDALRFLFMAQDDPTKRVGLVLALLDLAPETDNDAGIQLVLDLLAEASLKVEMVDPPHA